MKKVYNNQEFHDPKDFKPIFLVGPTPRKDGPKSWRDESLEILKEFADIQVIIPEPVDGKWCDDYDGQVEWEHEGLELAKEHGVIAAWVPRELEHMPAMTTNVEFGIYYKEPRFMYGRPDDAPKNRYLDAIYQKDTGKEPHNNLLEFLTCCVEQFLS